MNLWKILIVLIILLSFTAQCFAFNFSNVLSGASNLFTKSSSPVTESPEATQMIRSLAGVFFSAGVVVAIIVGLIIGIKFMTDGAVGQADLKTSLAPYLIGVIVLISGWGIWKAVVTIMQKI